VTLSMMNHCFRSAFTTPYSDPALPAEVYLLTYLLTNLLIYLVQI